MKKDKHVLMLSVLFLIFLSGLFVLTIGAAKYPTSRALMDRLSLDGSMESFTQARYQMLHLPLIVAGGIISSLGGLGLVFFSKTNQLLQRVQAKVQQYWQQIRNDLKTFWSDLLHPHFAWWEWVILVVLVLLAFTGSWVWVEKPMQHDESYTFIAFAQRPFLNIISDYHLPNNHILNSILIHVLHRIFGNPSPIIVRLPSLLAGVICVPLAFFWARKQFGRFAALVAAGFVGYLPWLKLQSTNGRGYMLMAMLTLLMLILAERVRGKKDGFAWILLIFATVLNFYTLPIALYPFAIIGLWLCLSALRGDITPAYGGFWRFFRYLVVYGLVSGVLVFLLYSPIFLFGSGWDSFFNNPFVESLGWQGFLQTLPIRLGETTRDWQLDLPVWFSIVLGIGVVLSLFFHRQGKSGKVPMQLCVLLALTLIFIVQRPNPWTRIWTYLLPMVLTWAAAGWFLAVRGLVQKDEKRTLPDRILLAVFMVILLGLSVQHIIQNMQYIHGEKGQEETVTSELQPLIHADDIVLTSSGFGPAFWYYFDMLGMTQSTIVNPDVESDWQNLYLIVDDRYDATPGELLERNLSELEDCRPEALETVISYGHYQVFVCNRP